MLRKNLLANFLGQSWTALMGLLFIPFYIRYLGIEAYGLIGLFALLTAWLSLLDMGMTPTLGREMARFTAGNHTPQSIRDLLRTLEIITFTVAVLIAGSVALGAGWIATSWLQAKELPVEIVVQAFIIMGLVTALRFAESIYRSSIIGLQRQVFYNVVNSSLATVRGVGAVAVLAWVSPTIQVFFLWQGLLSVLALVILASVTYASLPRAERMSRFSLDAVRSVWKFSGGMLVITFLALSLTQVDKILLSKLLSLSDYGYYTLAAVVAGALYMMITPITQAFYPRFCELHARNDVGSLAEAYHESAQLVSVLAGSTTIVIALFSETLLQLWTQDNDLAARAAPLLSLLILGNLLNGLMWIPYQTQLAHGWTGLSVRVNLVAVLLIVPLLFWATPRYGAEGAAWVWISLNFGYVIIGAHFMYRKILSTEKWRWYLQDLVMPLSASLGVCIGLKTFGPEADTVLSQIFLLALAAFLALATALLAAGLIRRQAVEILQSYWTQRKPRDGYY